MPCFFVCVVHAALLRANGFFKKEKIAALQEGGLIVLVL